MDVSVAPQSVQCAGDTVAVEADAHAHNEQHRPGCPAQKGHNEEGIAQNEGIIQSRDEVECHKPRAVCKQLPLSETGVLL